MAALARRLAAKRLVMAVLELCALWAAAPAAAIPADISGNLESLNLVRHRDIDQWAYITARNTARVRLDWGWASRGRLLDRFDLPGVKQGHLLLLYRGVYDGIYDLAPGPRMRDIFGQSVASIGDLSRDERDALRFESTLREGYLDLRLSRLPLELRLGKQMIVWGESDNFRMMDKANALDLSWHLQQEPWDELRRPYWMLKFLYRLGTLGPLSQSFLEWYWNPGDWLPAKQSFLPRPWGNPVANPLSGARLFAGTRAYRQGDWRRTPQENSQVGVRFHAMVPANVELTLDYFWQRWAGDDGSSTASFRAVSDPQVAARAFFERGELPLEFIAPYVHSVGATGTYFEPRTQAVVRLETIFEIGIPYNDRRKRGMIAVPAGVCGREEAGVVDDELCFGIPLLGVTRRNEWKGMVGIDRPTWVRWLNRGNTFFLSGQVFWFYLPQGTKFLEGPFGPLDDVRTWEYLFTLAATTLYRGGTVAPTFSYALDPSNSWSQELAWEIEWFVRNDLILEVSQRYFFDLIGASANAGTKANFEPQGLGGFNRGRSESGVRVVYQF